MAWKNITINRNTTNTINKMEWILATFLFFLCENLQPCPPTPEKKKKWNIFLQCPFFFWKILSNFEKKNLFGKTFHHIWSSILVW
jgi:hypothetical protein